MINYCADTSNFLTGVFCLILNPILDGFDNVTPYALHTLKFLAAFEVTLAAIWWGFGKEDVIEAFLKQVMKIGFFILVVANFQTLSGYVIETFIKVGIITGSTTGSATDAEVQEFARPGGLVDRGVSMFGSMINEISAIINWNVGASLSWPLGSLEPVVEGVQRMANFFIFFHFIVLIIICAIIAVILYFLMALQIFLAFMEFFITAVLSVILIPFGVFKHTEFASKQVFPMVFNHGVKLMIMAFIITVFDRLLPGGSSLTAFINSLGPVGIVLSTPPGKAYACVYVVMILFLMLKLLNEAPKLAAGIMSGSPQYNANMAAMAQGAATSIGKAVVSAKTGGAAGGAGGGAGGGGGLAKAASMGGGASNTGGGKMGGGMSSGGSQGGGRPRSNAISGGSSPLPLPAPLPLPTGAGISSGGNDQSKGAATEAQSAADKSSSSANLSASYLDALKNRSRSNAISDSNSE